MKHFNLSEWALAHRPFVLFLMLALTLAGAMSYQKLGQSEDPPFTFKVMVIRTFWPGATARTMEEQITDKIEKKLQETPNVDRLASYSKPGESTILFVMKDSAPVSEVPNTWYQVRKKVGDIRNTLPTGIQGPFFNDEFGDVLGNIYILTGDGFDYAALKIHADRIRQQLLKVPDVAKVDFIGEQEEKVYIEASNAKFATLGIDIQTIFSTLAQQNAMASSGVFETGSDKIFIRTTGDFDSVDSIREITIRANGRAFRLGDIARVYRGYVDPPAPKMRFMGKDGLGLGVSMAKGGDIVELGRNLDAQIMRLKSELPVGIDLSTVSNQPDAVNRSVSEFVRSLSEAVIIVLFVSLLSLGFRTGLVVALSIPVVLAITFLLMNVLGIGLHKISLGALILSLGLLVDDAIIAVEMMAIKMEQGWDRLKAGSFAYTSTAMPMLTGTLVTAAGFLPIATAQSSTGEYTRSIFQVTVLALLISWFAAVVFIPYLGYHLLPDYRMRGKDAIPRQGWSGRLGRLAAWLALPLMHLKAKYGIADAPDHDEQDVYNTAFYRRFRALVTWCVTYRRTVILVTLAIFLLTLFAFRFVQQQFFPASSRPEILIDLRLPEGSSVTATEQQVKKLEAILATDAAIENYVSYVGTGSPRFYLPLDQQLPANNFAQFVVLTRNLKDREAFRVRMIKLFDEDFSSLRANVTRLENGPPVGFPVQFRVTGADIPAIRKIANEVAAVMRGNPHLSNVQFDWDEMSKTIKVDIDQNKARLLGLSSQDISAFLSNSLSGFGVTFYRERDKLIEVLVRAPFEERAQLSFLKDVAVPTRAGKSVPLSQIANISYDFERGVVWRRNRTPTITVRATVYGDVQAPAVTAQIDPLLNPIRAKLPPAYSIDIGGAVEDSTRGQKSIAAGLPLFVVVVLTTLMLQLQSFQRVIMVVLTAPLGLIGVTLFLLIFNVPFGFVAMLGTIALSGMIMRNSVILVDQIEQDIAVGHPPWEAVIESTVRRFRPIVLTAAAAVLAMIPLTRSAFFGPMAVAIMGGLIVATALTLLFLPALYAAWFRVPPPQSLIRKSA